MNIYVHINICDLFLLTKLRLASGLVFDSLAGITDLLTHHNLNKAKNRRYKRNRFQFAALYLTNMLQL